jgi:hypothetical protein
VFSVSAMDLPTPKNGNELLSAIQKYGEGVSSDVEMYVETLSGQDI